MPAAPYADADVIAALQRQLDRVDRHPQRDTPEADEVRLALHAAAAQLLDPAVQQRLRARWAGAAPSGQLPRSEAATALESPADALVAMERDIVLVLGTSGGWNARALRRVTAMGHARGMTSDQIVAAVTALARRDGTRGAPPDRETSARAARSASVSPVARDEVLSPPARRSPSHSAAPASGHAPASLSPASSDTATNTREPSARPADPIRRLAIFALLALVGVGSVVIGIILLTAPRQPKVAIVSGPVEDGETPQATEQSRPSVMASEPVPAANLPPISDEGDPRGTTRDLRAATEALSNNAAAALARFEAAYERLGRQWPALPPDQRVAAADAALEFIYRAAVHADVVQRAADLIAGPHAALASSSAPTPEQVLPSIWAAAMLARLQREGDLPSIVRQRLVMPGGSDMGVAPPSAALAGPLAAAAARWPQRLVGTRGLEIAPRAVWLSWLVAVEALGIDDPSLRPRLILDALERLLTTGPSPERDRTTLAVVTELTTRLTWRPDEGSRPWLLRVLTDPKVPAGSVRAVTLVLARQSRAEGVDATMILSGAAGQFERAELRERYAEVWNLAQAIVQSDARSAWLAAARDAIDGQSSTADDLERMARLATLARLHQAAAELARGDAEAAALTIADARAPVDAIVASAAASPTGPPADLSDGAWAERFLGARANPRARRDALNDLATRNVPLGPIDAEVLLAEALTAPGDTRGVAMELIKRRGADLAVVAALLERLPRMGRTPANASLIEAVSVRTLPPTRDPAWPIAARRALVERVGDLLAAQGERAAVDRLAELTRAAYSAQIIGRPPVADVEPASALYQHVRGQIDPLAGARPGELSLDSIERRRVARLAIARGPMQRFAADQTSIAELRALSTIVTRPARADAAQEIITQLDRQRRDDRSILDQLVRTESAIIRLWILVLEDDAS